MIQVLSDEDIYRTHQNLESMFRVSDDVRGYLWRQDVGSNIVQVRLGTTNHPFASGDRIDYVVDALPRKRVGNARVPFVADKAARNAWFCKRMTNAGLIIGMGSMITETPVRRYIKKRNQKPFTLFGFRFSGVAVVADPELLTHALNNGIGEGKPYGFGLLTVEKNCA